MYLLEAENGREALTLVQATQVPSSLLVLLDLQMLVLDGFEFLELFQHLPNQCSAQALIGFGFPLVNE